MINGRKTMVSFGRGSGKRTAVKLSSGSVVALALSLILSGCMTVQKREESGYLRVGSLTISQGSPYWKYAQKFGERNPIEEAGKAFDKRRFSIYSASGYALYYPGLDYGLGRLLAGRYGAMALPGFAKGSQDREQLAYMRLAEQYAAAYNQEMRLLLTESGLLKP